MENKSSDKLLDVFLNNKCQLPNDVLKDIWEDHEADYWVSYNKENPVDQ